MLRSDGTVTSGISMTSIDESSGAKIHYLIGSI
jgi:hypothetical protein